MGKKLKQIKSIALNVVKETLRNNTFMIMMISALLVFALSHVLGNMAIGAQERVIQSTGFWVIGVWGLIGAVNLGSNAITDEIRRKTLYIILSRQVSRTVFMIGKFTGLILVLMILFFAISFAFILQIYLYGFDITSAHWIALTFIFLEWIVLGAFSIFFASFTSSLLSAFFLTSLYIIGHWGRSFYILAENTDNMLVKKGVLYLYYLLPNFELLNFRTAVLYNEPVAVDLMFGGVLLTFGWTLTMLISGILIFNFRRLS